MAVTAVINYKLNGNTHARITKITPIIAKDTLTNLDKFIPKPTIPKAKIAKMVETANNST